MRRSTCISQILLLILPVSLLAQVPADEVVITASSILPASNTSDFSPANVMDGTSDSWSEGVSGPGIGETLHFEMRYPDMLRYVMIRNGFGEENYWKANARVKELKITDESGNSRLLTLDDTPDPRVYGLFDLQNDESGNLLSGPVLRGKEFLFEVQDIYPGERWEDLCISEIGFNQWYYPGFELERSYVIKNLFAEYFGGIFNRKGELLVDTDFEGLKKLDISGGYFEEEISSGDGTQGISQYQAFIDLESDCYLIFSSDDISEISQASMEGKMDENGAPVRTTSRAWRVDRYDTETGRFQKLSREEQLEYFDPDPDRALTDYSGSRLTVKDIWISVENPGMLKVTCPDCPGHPASAVLYVWDRGAFRLYTE